MVNSDQFERTKNKMKKEELIKTSIYIITEYYKNNTKPFFDYMADDVLWIGPRNGQIISGKEAMIRTWDASENNLIFSMGNIEVLTSSTGRANLEVMLEYYVYTHFPNGKVDKHHQRLHLSWGNRRMTENGESVTVPRMCMIHISNIADTAISGKVYPTSEEESVPDAVDTLVSRTSSRTVYGKDTNDTVYYFNSSTILWIESADNGQHAIVHTTEGEIKAAERLRYFEKEFSGELLRAHISYLVNPLYVRSIKRFEVELTDGTILSIPEKKYTAFRKQLEEWSPENH